MKTKDVHYANHYSDFRVKSLIPVGEPTWAVFVESAAAEDGTRTWAGLQFCPLLFWALVEIDSTSLTEEGYEGPEMIAQEVLGVHDTGMGGISLNVWRGQWPLYDYGDWRYTPIAYVTDKNLPDAHREAIFRKFEQSQETLKKDLDTYDRVFEEASKKWTRACRERAAFIQENLRGKVFDLTSLLQSHRRR